MGSIMDATATITPSEPAETGDRHEGHQHGHHHDHRHGLRPSSLTAALLAGVLTCVMLGLGIPQLVGAVSALGAAAVIEDLQRGHTPDAKALTAAADSLAHAAAWDRNGVHDTHRGTVLSALAETAPSGPEQQALYTQAIAAVRAGLSRAPGQPHAWAHLAALLERTGDRIGAADALRLSMLSGAVEPALMLWRIDQGLRLRALLDPDTVSMLRRQIRLTWVITPEEVAALSKRPDAVALVQDSLALLTQEEVDHYIRLHGKR